MAQSKATKRFGRKNLKDVVKKRKDKTKLGFKIKEKKQAQEEKRVQKAAQELGETTGTAENPVNGKKTAPSFEEMTVDEFFQGGFDLPEALQTKAERKGKRKPDVAATTGKRKRSAPLEQSASDEDVESASEGEGRVEASEGSVEADSEDDPEVFQQQLEALAKKDPEFHKYLQENDADLLDFNADNFAEIDALSDDESPNKKRRLDESSDEEGTSSNKEVSVQVLKKWETAMVESKSLRAAREVVLAFRAAAHLNDDSSSTFKYSVSSSDVYNKLLNIALKHVPGVLDHHLPIKQSKSGKISVPTDSKKFRTLTPMLKSYCLSIEQLLENLSDNATLRLTITSVEPLLPYILSFKKIVKNLIKLVVDAWAAPSSNEATRIAAFLVLRRLVVISDSGIKEGVLRATYQGLVKGARNTTVHTLQGINLMKNSAAELWGIDPAVGYTTGFTFIRQLAIHLRTSITNKTKDSYKAVYNWQYVHSLDFWSRVLSQNCASLREAELGKESALRPLIYPLVQVTLGAMRLIPTAQYYPLRFHLIRSLLRISLTTTTFIPLAPALYEVLTSREMKKPPKSSTLKAIDFDTTIRATKAYLHTRSYQDGLGEQVSELFSEFFVLWTKSIAFPELALPVIVMLKRWLKDVTNRSSGNKNTKLNSMISLIVQKLETNSKWVEERRAKVEFAPNNRAGVESFLKEEAWEKTPLGAFVAGQRKSREEKAKLIEQGRKDEERQKKEDQEEDDNAMITADGAFSASEAEDGESDAAAEAGMEEDDEEDE